MLVWPWRGLWTPCVWIIFHKPTKVKRLPKSPWSFCCLLSSHCCRACAALLQNQYPVHRMKSQYLLHIAIGLSMYIVIAAVQWSAIILSFELQTGKALTNSTCASVCLIHYVDNSNTLVSMCNAILITKHTLCHKAKLTIFIMPLFQTRQKDWSGTKTNVMLQQTLRFQELLMHKNSCTSSSLALTCKRNASWISYVYCNISLKWFHRKT